MISVQTNLLKNVELFGKMWLHSSFWVRTMEREILLEQGQLQVPCKLSSPDNGTIRRVVLGVHGFGGSAEDVIQTGIAEEMRLFGAATVRFDFPGHGRNPMAGDAFTLENCLGALTLAARYGLQLYPDACELCIFATGFGAYVTLIALPELLELPVKVKLVLQTPSVRMDRTLLAMLQKSEQTLRVEERVVLPLERPLVLSYSLYKEFRQNVAMEAPAVPMLILQGEKDAYINMEDIQNFRRNNDRAKLVIIPGASHRFLEEGAWDMVLDLTRDWFEFEQVLLSDWE